MKVKDRTEELLKERGAVHGDWKIQSAMAYELKRQVRLNNENLLPFQQEALESICTKISRICCGDPNEPDHWKDIEGYARLGSS